MQDTAQLVAHLFFFNKNKPNKISELQWTVS